MKKITVFVIVLMAACSLVAGPPRGRHHHHHHGGNNGLAMAADIVSICANGVFMANQLSTPRVVYTQPVYYQQPIYQPAPQPVYVQPTVLYAPPPQPVYYRQPVQYYTPVVYEPSTVIVRERRPFILTRIIDAILP